MIYLCSCGFDTDDPDWLDGHLFQHPDHFERPWGGGTSPIVKAPAWPGPRRHCGAAR